MTLEDLLRLSADSNSLMTVQHWKDKGRIQINIFEGASVAGDRAVASYTVIGDQLFPVGHGAVR